MQRERWPVNFVTPDQLQAHRSRQQSQMDFWDHYRRGQPWSQHQREPIYRHFQVPKTIPPWLGPRQLFVPNPGHPGAPRPVGSRFTQQIPQPFWVMDPRGVEARKNVRALTREFYPDRFFFVKTLSWGGFGVASLFEVGNSQNPATRRVFVVKTNLIGEDVAASQRDAARRRATSMMKREKHFQQKFLRAKHIVQIMQPKKTRTSARVAAAQPPAGGFPYAPMASEDPPTAAFARENTMILEYLVRGDLRKNLGAIAHDPNAVVPNRVLWSIFRCLVGACAAMEYPPLKFNRGRVQREGGKYGPPIEETIPPRADLRTNIVHSDIDPRNVLVGDYSNDGKHDHIPVMKIGDFGLADEKTHESLGDLLMWSDRRAGKPFYYPPESFTEEWDYIDLVPRLQGATVAANYSWKSNLWQVAMVMFNCITLCKPPDFQDVTMHHWMDVNGNNRQGWTYGGVLLGPAFDAVEYELRDLVAQCLCDDPAERPEMDVLLGIIDQQLAGPWHAPQDDASIRAWSDNAFGNPAPRASRPHGRLWRWAMGETNLPWLI